MRAKRRRRCRWMETGALLPLLLMLGSAAAAQSGASLEAGLARRLDPPLAKSATVSAVRLQWPGLDFELQQGEVALAAAEDGRVTTAVFTGEGRLRVAPPTAMGRQQALRFTGAETMDQFFSEATFYSVAPGAWSSRLAPSLHWNPEASGHARGALKDAARNLERDASDAVPRWLAALAATAPGPGDFLLAELKLHDGRWLEVDFDPARREPVEVSEPSRGAIWAQFAPPGWSPPGPAWRLSDYQLQAGVAGNRELTVEAAFTLTAVAGGRPALTLLLDDQLRLTSATLAAGGALAWLQPKAASGGDWLYLQLPRPLAAGGTAQVRLTYAGKNSLRDTALPWDWLAPAHWYPALDTARPAPPTAFHLRLSADHRYTVSASSVAGAVRAAGFAVGEDEVQNQRVELANGQQLTLSVAAAQRNDPEAVIPLGGARLVDAGNFLTGYYGPLPYTALAVSMSGPVTEPIWPGLVSLDPGWFAEMTTEQAELPIAASLAGQWWGAWTQAASPHDRWLVAGLRVASGLFYQQARSGMPAGLDALRAWRQLLLRPGRNGEVAEQQGALWLGPDRLSTDQDDGEAMLEAKAAYGIYELRQMMRDPRRANPDAAFIAMLRDFIATYGGRAVTTADFQAIVTKHMTAAMDLEHNHTMDWFFRPLLDNTAAPELHFSASTVAIGPHPAPPGGAEVELKVANPGHWQGLLPVYLFEDNEHWIRGLMPVTHAQETLIVPVPFQPRYVEANHFLDMLVRVQQ